jgi:hypothetical protein
MSSTEPPPVTGEEGLSLCDSGQGGTQRQQLVPCSLKTVLPKPLSCLGLPDSPHFIALFQNFGAVHAIEAKLVGSPESGADSYSENEDSLHCSSSPTQGGDNTILKLEC